MGGAGSMGCVYASSIATAATAAYNSSQVGESRTTQGYATVNGTTYSAAVNLLFNGGHFNSAKTSHSMEFTNGTSINSAKAGGSIHANSSNFGNLTADEVISLINSSVHSAHARKKILATDCTSSGCLSSDGQVKLLKHSGGSAKAKGKIHAIDCKNLISLFSESNVIVQKSSIDSVTAENASIKNNSNILKELKCYGKVKIKGSSVNSVKLLQRDKNTKVGKRVSKLFHSTKTLYLDNSIVGDIEFEGQNEGKVILKGNSRVTGTITNGKIVKK